MNFILVEALTFGLARLVQAAEKLNVTLHLLTYNKDIYFCELANINSKHLVVTELDTFDQNKIITYCQNLPDFAAIINLTDSWANSVREVSALTGRKVQNPLATVICRDKAKLRTILQEKGLTQGKLSLIEVHGDNKEMDIHFPVIIKDPAGTGSKNVWFAANNKELSSVIEFIKNNTNLTTVLVETYFNGTLYSAEAISFNGKTKLIAVTSRILSDMPRFMEIALSLPLDINNSEFYGLEAWIHQVLRAIGWQDGYTHTEFIISATGFEVVEVNPRLGGGLIGEALCQACDYNIYQAFIEIAMGHEPEIFNIDLQAKKYLAQVLIYAKEKGIFKSVDQHHINQQKTRIYPYALAGKPIDNLSDQSACVAILLTSGSSSETALLNAMAEANKVKVLMESDHA